VKETAEQLGNTPAICRSSYIYPSVLTGFERGRVVDSYFDTVEELLNRRRHGLHGSEKALLELLCQKAA
jgi:DNA topoisomerase-1